MLCKILLFTFMAATGVVPKVKWMLFQVWYMTCLLRASGSLPLFPDLAGTLQASPSRERQGTYRRSAESAKALASFEFESVWLVRI